MKLGRHSGQKNTAVDGYALNISHRGRRHFVIGMFHKQLAEVP